MRLIRKELEQQKLGDCRNVPIESNHEYGSSLSNFSCKYNWIFISKPLIDVLILAEEVLAIESFYQVVMIISNTQQCDLDEVVYIAKSKTMLIVLMPLTRTMCSLVILMRQSYSIAAAGIGSSVQSGAEEGGSLIKLELYLQPVPPPSLSSHRFWLHIDIVKRIQLVLHKETWISWILTTNVGQRGWLGPKKMVPYWYCQQIIDSLQLALHKRTGNLAFSDSLTSGQRGSLLPKDLIHIEIVNCQQRLVCREALYIVQVVRNLTKSRFTSKPAKYL